LNNIKLWLARLLRVEVRVTRTVFVVDPIMVARIAKAMPSPSPDNAAFGQGIQYVLHALRTQAFYD
jgi:hypothetical protein